MMKTTSVPRGWSGCRPCCRWMRAWRDRCVTGTPGGRRSASGPKSVRLTRSASCSEGWEGGTTSGDAGAPSAGAAAMPPSPSGGADPIGSAGGVSAPSGAEATGAIAWGASSFPSSVWGRSSSSNDSGGGVWS